MYSIYNNVRFCPKTFTVNPRVISHFTKETYENNNKGTAVRFLRVTGSEAINLIPYSLPSDSRT